jgi:peptide/nickel transport system permease protein
MMRALMSLFTLLAVSLIVFSLMELVPGNCAERYIAFKNTQGQTITIEDIQAEERRLGLDKPFVIRWGTWVGKVFFKGEFGDSCILRLNINQLLSDKFWISLGLALSALIVSYIIAIPVGIYSASTRNPFANNALRFISYLGLALPNFLLALIIMLTSTVLFGDSLTGLFSKEFRDAAWSYAKFMDFLSRAWLPIFILGWSATAFAMQTVRALMLDEIDAISHDQINGFLQSKLARKPLGLVIAGQSAGGLMSALKQWPNSDSVVLMHASALP